MKRCDCIAEMNLLLADRGVKLDTGINLRTGREHALLHVCRIDPRKRGRLPTVLPSYCPFCGIDVIEPASKETRQ